MAKKMSTAAMAQNLRKQKMKEKAESPADEKKESGGFKLFEKKAGVEK